VITSIPLRIVVLAPFVTRSAESGAVGIDLPLARTAPVRNDCADAGSEQKDSSESLGKVMIPGSHVIGKLAAAMRELRDLLGDDPLAADFQTDLTELLAARDGLPSTEAENESDGREARRALTASDFILETPEGDARSRTRIAIDNVRSTVLDGMLQVVEQPFATDQRLEFRGHMRVIGPCDEARRRRIIKALQFVTQMGALRTVGYGQIVEVTCDEIQPAAPRKSTPIKQPRFLMRLQFEDVFCAGESRNSPNTYTSADHVPGGVIKGSIARQMLASVGRSGFLDDERNIGVFEGDLAILANNFGRIRIRHAQPVPKGTVGRPFRYVPDSLAAIENDDGETVIVDLAGLDDPSTPVLIDGKVPIAPFDWKGKHQETAKALLGLTGSPGRLLRVRTQVADDTRAAATSRLFGIEYTRGDCHDFVAEIDLSACTEPDLVIRGLQLVIAEGLGGIGRGGAFAQVSLEKIPPETHPIMGKRIVAVLQSAALLRDPSRPAVNLRSAYADAFAELGLPETITLRAVFVRERLAGGGFFRSRLAQKDRVYAPFMLTEAGATFVFDSSDGTPIDPAQLFPNGLDVPQSVLVHHGIEDLTELYRVCPYLPQNGYGELVGAPFQTEGRALWQAREPSALGLTVEIVDALLLALEA
jgi:hypothetical protein